MDPNARILLLDTSGKTGALGLAAPHGVITANHLPGQLRHAAELLPTLEALLTRQHWAADSLTDVFLTIGPGSFTGLRLGVSVARTLAWSVGARIVTVGTMDVLARNALSAQPPPAHVAVLLDAKRGQAFAAAFELGNDRYNPIINACLEEPQAFLARCPRPVAVLGEGVPLHQAALGGPGVTVLPPELWPAAAEHVFALGIERALAGQYTPAGDVVPFYVRRPEMEERWEQRQKK